MKRPHSSTSLWGQRQRVSCHRVAFSALTPFALACLVGLLVFRRGGSSTLQQPLHRHPARSLVQEAALPCLGSNCEMQGGSSGLEDVSLGVAGGHDAGAPSAAAASGHRVGGATPSPGELPKLFLFIGILSGRGYRHRRLAVREAWSSKAQMAGEVVSKFILSEDERTPQVEKELEAYGDIVFVQQKTNYKSILYKTFYVLEYASLNYDAAFVLKTDDDAFINVPPMVAQLRALCENPGCVNERIYMGRMAKHSEVLLQPGHKWNNAAFHNHTGLREYPNYMMGGGYVMGGEVARVLVDVHMRMHLKFTPIEDATLGFWLMAMDLRHIDHPRFYTWAAPCCFKPPVRKAGERFVTRFQLAEDFDEGLCSTDPWLVLHKIDSPTKMRFVGSRVANCSAPEPWVLPASIQEQFSQEKKQHWAEQRVSFLRSAGRPMDSPPPPPRLPPPKEDSSNAYSSTLAAVLNAAAAGAGSSGTAGLSSRSHSSIAAAVATAAAAGRAQAAGSSTAGSQTADALAGAAAALGTAAAMATDAGLQRQPESLGAGSRGSQVADLGLQSQPELVDAGTRGSQVVGAGQQTQPELVGAGSRGSQVVNAGRQTQPELVGAGMAGSQVVGAAAAATAAADALGTAGTVGTGGSGNAVQR